ncbi:type 4b pilus protein PilO2 [Acerihabitans sp. TG2]|uniref:type 4b pilus protein PilO2 n=1 Tax=Acerihabitans sp. TG2 TaxID=3096008 RepID=UPI002B23577A|nr:type 4b pilus protein PilO2 [Acerihabitans sp. TG2]MEA9392193.1 type 4b pilus protein PilO2 [Acerihabitans sp. TG2]
MTNKVIDSVIKKFKSSHIARGNSGQAGSSKPLINQKIDVLRINGADFVSGLVWNTISNARGIMSEARRFGRENNMDVVAIRERLMKAQAGYVGKNKGVNKEMYSLASTLAGILEQVHLSDQLLQQKVEEEHNPENEIYSEGAAWLGVFEIAPPMMRNHGRKEKYVKENKKEDQNLSVSDVNLCSVEIAESAMMNIQKSNMTDQSDEKLYYILAVVDGNVVPQSDKLGTRKEIERLQGKINSLYSSTKKLHKYYFPSDWGRGESEIILSDLLSPASLNKGYKLKQLTWGMTKREIGVVGLLIVIGCMYISYDRYNAHLREIEFQRLQQAENDRIALQRKRIREATGSDVKINDLVRPWVSKPSVREFLDICHRRLKEIPTYMGGGWALIKIDCQEKNIKLDYVRGVYSTVDDFRRDVTRIFGVAADIPGDQNGNRGYVVISNAMRPAGNEEPGSLTDLMSSFASQFQQVEAEYNFKNTEIEKLPKLPGQTVSEEKTQLAPWSTTSFEVKSGFEPSNIFTNTNLSVVRIESIITNISESNYSWTTIGKLYAKR